jgi:hypothetical protein
MLPPNHHGVLYRCAGQRTGSMRVRAREDLSGGNCIFSRRRIRVTAPSTASSETITPLIVMAASQTKGDLSLRENWFVMP